MEDTQQTKMQTFWHGVGKVLGYALVWAVEHPDKAVAIVQAVKK